MMEEERKCQKKSVLSPGDARTRETRSVVSSKMPNELCPKKEKSAYVKLNTTYTKRVFTKYFL